MSGLDGLFEFSLADFLKTIGIKISTLKALYLNEGGIGGFGIVFGNTFGMIIAHILLVLTILLAVIGLITVITWIAGRKKRKMDPHERWLKTGHT